MKPRHTPDPCVVVAFIWAHTAAVHTYVHTYSGVNVGVNKNVNTPSTNKPDQ